MRHYYRWYFTKQNEFSCKKFKTKEIRFLDQKWRQTDIHSQHELHFYCAWCEAMVSCLVSSPWQMLVRFGIRLHCLCDNEIDWLFVFFFSLFLSIPQILISQCSAFFCKGTKIFIDLCFVFVASSCNDSVSNLRMLKRSEKYQ